MTEQCPECGGEMRVLGGCSAHPDNWYCKDRNGCGYQAWTPRQNESSRSPAGSTADAIVNDLFRNGFGDEAERLVLDVPGRTLGNGGGWCRNAVRDVILKHLSR